MESSPDFYKNFRIYYVPLKKLFNKSLSLGKLPSEWKDSRISAIYKKGCRKKVGNYWPISLTSIVCKTLEHCARNHIVNHIYTIILLKSVGVRKLQIAIVARSPRDMSQTDRIVWKHILSRVRVSVRPRICFIREQKPKSIINTESPACCLFQWITDRQLSRQRRKRGAQPWWSHGWAHRYSEQRRSWVGWGCACSRVWAGVCVRACVRAWFVLQYTIMIFTHADNDNN